MADADKIEASRKRVAAAVTAGGGLDSLGWYLWWTVGEETATLDGEFTAADLRAIADHMDSHGTT